MEIRFCSVCNESIPDGEFEAGRAVVSAKRSQHVACALRRSVEMGGLRRWLTFGLALLAAAISTFLLVARISERAGPEEAESVPAVVAQHVADAVRLSEERATLVEAQNRERLKGDVVGDFERSLKEALGTSVREALDKQDERLRETAKQVHDRLTNVDAHITKMQQQLAQLLVWRGEIEKEADRLGLEIAALGKQQPAAPPPDATPPTPPQPEGAGPAAVDPEREREIERWRLRLRDPDEDIVFSATIELARLRALSATPDLLEVLNKHKDFYARLGAATALGEIQAADSVSDLIEALNDKDDLVRTAASEALTRITEQDFNFVSGLSKNERVRIQKRWRAWWRENETSVRGRLDQPPK